VEGCEAGEAVGEGVGGAGEGGRRQSEGWAPREVTIYERGRKRTSEDERVSEEKKERKKERKKEGKRNEVERKLDSHRYRTPTVPDHSTPPDHRACSKP